MCSTVIQHLIHFYQPSGGSLAPNDLNCRFWPKIDHFWTISETQPVIKNLKKCVLITQVSLRTLLKPLKLGSTWKTDVALISLHCPIWHTVRYQTWIKDWDVVNGNHNDLHPSAIQTWWTMRTMLITFDQYLGWHGDYNLKIDIVDDMAIIIAKFWCEFISDLDSGVSLNLRSGSQTGRQNSRWWGTIWWLYKCRLWWWRWWWFVIIHSCVDWLKRPIQLINN